METREATLMASLPVAIGLAAMLGPSQVASRVLQILAGKRHPIWTTLISVVLVAIGLVLVAAAPALTALGLVLYGAGNGLRAIVRGLLPLALMPPAQYVALMGKMSRPSLIGQALTAPFAGNGRMVAQVFDGVSVGVADPVRIATAFGAFGFGDHGQEGPDVHVLDSPLCAGLVAHGLDCFPGVDVVQGGGVGLCLSCGRVRHTADGPGPQD